MKAVRTFELREEHIRAVGRAYGAVPAEGQTEMTGLDQGLWSVAVLPSVMCGAPRSLLRTKKGWGVFRLCRFLLDRVGPLHILLSLQ